MNLPVLPSHGTPAAFDAWRVDLANWRPGMEALAATLGGGPVQLKPSGTVLVALLGSDRVLKLYPPFLHNHFGFERAALRQIGGRLQLPTPRLLHSGHHQGRPWLFMTQLAGEPLTAR